MSPFRRKAVENALVAVLRELGGNVPVLKEARRLVGEKIDGCSATEMTAAVQSLRYAGKLSWDRLELTPSMLIGTSAAPARVWPDEEVPGEVNDATTGGEDPATLPPAGPPADAPPAVAGFVPKPLLHKAGVHGAATRAAGHAVPVPAHEPEVARQVREEVEEIRERRRRAVSTGTVRRPLERRLGIPDLTFAEGVVSLLAETPADLMAAISRKHPLLWRRLILLGRARGERTAQVLYAALEVGVAAMEAQRESAAHEPAEKAA